ncbi:MAG: type II secretion system protein GspG [Deltaproteobacteria bacterium]|nr:type II secretion system protein GspG [Deltaproteobacteria bacterium]
MPRQRSPEQSILFPWERGRGLWRLRFVRSRPLLAGLGMAALLLVLGARERTRTGVRATRATLLVVRQAIDAYRADHEMRCPPTLGALRQDGYLRRAPVDAWGQPLELVCPGRRDPEGYDLSSPGARGAAAGLARIE